MPSLPFCVPAKQTGSAVFRARLLIFPRFSFMMKRVSSAVCPDGGGKKTRPAEKKPKHNGKKVIYMKRYISIALAVLLVVALLAGCAGGGANVAGKYVVKSVGDQTVKEYFESMAEEFAGLFDLDDLLELFEISSFEEFMTIELNADGTAKITVAGEDDDTSTATWKQQGNKIIVTYDGETQELDLNNGELSFKDEEGVKYTFVKK